MIKVVKKDGTLEDFNVQKVVDAVNKSACRVLINFTEEEEKFIESIFNYDEDCELNINNTPNVGLRA